VKPEVTLTEWAERYILARDLSDFYVRDVRRVIGWFVAWNIEQRLDHLTDDHLNQWAKQLKREGKNPKTIKMRLSTVKSVWRDAFMAGECQTEPRRVVKIKCPRSMPVAWTHEELRRLLDAAATVPLWFKRTGIRKAAFWRAFILVAYDSALRLNDLESLRREQIQTGGRIIITQHKTGTLHSVRLRPETLAAIKQLEPWDAPGRGDVIFWWGAGRSEFFRQFRRLLLSAGLTSSYGLTRRLRRSSATAAEAVQPGIASLHLGHSPESGNLAHRHYLDPRLLPERVTTPPPLVEAFQKPVAMIGFDPTETTEIVI